MLGAVVLVTGSAEFLAERVVGQARAALLDDDPDADLTDVEAMSLDPGDARRADQPVVVRRQPRSRRAGPRQPARSRCTTPLVAYASAPADDVAMVLVHPGGQRGKGLLDRLREAGAREVKAEAPKPWQLSGWLSAEARGLGSPLDDGAADALLLAVGERPPHAVGGTGAADRRQPGPPDRHRTVRAAFEGRAEVKSFDIADRAIAGDAAGALELLRWALAQRVPLPLVTSAFARDPAPAGQAGLRTAAGCARRTSPARSGAAPTSSSGCGRRSGAGRRRLGDAPSTRSPTPTPPSRVPEPTAATRSSRWCSPSSRPGRPARAADARTCQGRHPVRMTPCVPVLLL